MTLSWGSPLQAKSLSIVYGSEWDKCDFKFLGFRKTPLGWDFNIWRVMISYDNYGRVKRR